jgi:hypothetical protein
VEVLGARARTLVRVIVTLGAIVAVAIVESAGRRWPVP